MADGLNALPQSAGLGCSLIGTMGQAIHRPLALGRPQQSTH